MGRWSGRLITRNPVTPSGPGPTASAPGIWTLPEVAYWNKQGRWPSASADPYWSYVSFLLGTTSTNAAQNNTFLDSSTNNFTITRNGNTTQGAFTPYGTLWSNYFDGNGDYLQTTAVNISSGNFTVEAWVYLNTMPTTDSWPGSFANWMVIAGVGSASASDGWQFRIGQTVLAFGTNGDTTAVSATHSMVVGQWYHLAVTRSGNVYTLYRNGTSIGSATYTANAPGTGAFTWIGTETNQGAYLNGYASNVRVVAGTAVYTANFTPSAAPLSATSDTVLLTCQSNRFRDTSTNNFVITRGGDARVMPFSPFVLAPPGYAASVSGGSGYFDGNGDYLSLAGSSAFSIATSTTPFTVEMWLYPTAAGGVIFTEAYTGSGTIPISITMATNANSMDPTGGRYIAFGAYNGSAWTVAAYSSSQIQLNTWTHVACVFTGSTTKIFFNGVDVTAGTPATTWPVTGVAGDGWYVGRRWDTYADVYFSGYISDFRFTNGTAVYTSAFTPPTAPLTAITNTSLLLNFTNAGIFDASMNSDMETTGNTQVSTGQAKFGTTSAYFDGSGVLSVPANPAFNFSTGDFTIECWLYPTATATVYLVGQAASNDYAPVLLYLTSGRPGIAVSPSNGTWTINNYVASALTLNTWSHVAAVRYGNKWSIYVNGVETVIAASTAVTPYISTDPLGIGGEATGAPNYPYYGYIDDLRITRGYARYTANFTPPTAALPVY